MQGNGERLHALDALRGFAMLLGILLHGALAYMQYPLPTWPVRDADRGLAGDLFVYGVHSFRMQLFFLLAGFFACLIYRRYGVLGFLRHRFTRIAVPFGLGLLLIQPQLQAIFLYRETAERLSGIQLTFREFVYPPHAGSPAQAVAGHFGRGDFLRAIEPMHLWFLYYLLVCYAAMLVLRPVLARATFARRPLRALLSHPLAVGGLTLLTLPLLLMMKTWQVDSPGGWLPVPRVLAYYFLFFSLGWFLFQEPDLLWKLAARWPRYLVSALVALPVAAIATAAALPLELTGATAQLGWAFPWVKAAAILAQGLYTWFAIWGSIGLFQRLLDRPNPGVRYLADASYWCYLMSLTPILLLQMVLEPLPWPGAVKFLTVVSLTLALLLLSYEAWVRYTWVGRLLHGHKERPREMALVESRAGTV